MKKVIMAIAAVMVLSLSLLVGCGGGGEAPDTLEGTTWEVTQYSMNGQEMDLGSLGVTLTLHFENGQVTSNGFVEATDYTYENGKLIIEGDTADVTGNTIHIQSDGNSMTLTRK